MTQSVNNSICSRPAQLAKRQPSISHSTIQSMAQILNMTQWQLASVIFFHLLLLWAFMYSEYR